MQFVAAGPASAGITSEVISFYLAENVKKVGPGGGDASEDIKVHVVPLSQAVSWLGQKVAEGLQVDVKVLAGLYILTEQFQASRKSV